MIAIQNSEAINLIVLINLIEFTPSLYFNFKYKLAPTICPHQTSPIRKDNINEENKDPPITDVANIITLKNMETN